MNFQSHLRTFQASPKLLSSHVSSCVDQAEEASSNRFVGGFCHYCVKIVFGHDEVLSWEDVIQLFSMGFITTI